MNPLSKPAYPGRVEWGPFHEGIWEVGGHVSFLGFKEFYSPDT